MIEAAVIIFETFLRHLLYVRVKKTNLLHYLTSACFLNQPLHVSDVFIAHHHEVHPYLYNKWYLLLFLVDCLLSWLGWFEFQHNQDTK